MGMTASALATAALWTSAAAAVTGAAVGTYSAIQSHEDAKEANDLTAESQKAAAAAAGRAQAKSDFAEENAKNNTAKESTLPELEGALSQSKKKKGVQSTFTATTGAGAGMMKGTTLSPLGE